MRFASFENVGNLVKIKQKKKEIDKKNFTMPSLILFYFEIYFSEKNNFLHSFS